MRASFFVCIAGIAVYLCVLLFYFMKISAKKNAMKKEGKKIQKASASFVSSLLLCALVELLPILIPLKIYVIAIVCLCGILGSYLVLKERLEKL
ncbi:MULTISPECIES: hypothetical protein [unclassified Treponema]|uniref:hypothetical protein n=1 Tax=unclassified Treponema TaxID=2638727 RepID=UPI000E8FB26A|nr:MULTISPECIES: hypothetical protein [unclassified Treponema]HAZ97283.1 hypothetical protein [Treponema sp.]HBP08841.1 hypothetical protein [Treponema sp.]